MKKRKGQRRFVGLSAGCFIEVMPIVVSGLVKNRYAADREKGSEKM